MNIKSKFTTFFLSLDSGRRDLLCLIGVCLVAVCMMLPIIIKGIPRGNDMPQHFQFAVTIHDSLVAGDLYPAWMENENAGYGGVGMRFYPPVGYYALAIGKMITGNWFAATCLVFSFWLALSGIGAFLWCRERSDSVASMLGGIAFVAAPYHINEIYNAFNYAEFAAVAFLPFCFLFVDRLTREGKLFNFAGLATAYAFLVLSNLPVAVMGTIALGIYSLLSLPRKGFVISSLRVGGAYLLGAALSAFYWLKVVTEMSWLNHSSDQYSAGSTHYDYRVNFLLQTKYLTEFDDRDMWFANLVLMFTLFLVVPLGLVYWRAAGSFAAKRLNRVWVGLLFAVFMATAFSYPLWANVSLLQKVQFPWRWLAVISIAGIPLVAAGWEYCIKWMQDKRRPLALIVVGMFAFGINFTIFQVARSAMFHPAAEFEGIVSTLATEKNFDCWLTVWAKEDAMLNQEKVSAGGRAVDGLHWARKDRGFTAAAGAPATARLATYYYPFWRVKINGNSVPSGPATDGAITFDLPAEEARVEVKFVEPASLVAVKYFSLGLWLLTLFYFAFRKVRGFRSEKAAAANPLQNLGNLGNAPLRVEDEIQVQYVLRDSKDLG